MSRLDRTNAVHHVYRCYDETGRLIYVGSSANLFGRLEQHRRTSWWAHQAAQVTAKVYPNGTIAREYERRAIRTEAPRWNKAGRWVTRGQWTREQWDDWLLMLLERNSFPNEIRKVAGLYARRWGSPAPTPLLARLEQIEADWEIRKAEWEGKAEAARLRRIEIEREDELALRRERKARKKAKAKKRAKKVARRRSEVSR